MDASTRSNYDRDQLADSFVMQQDLISLLLDCLHQDPSRLDANRLMALNEQDWQALLSQAGKLGVLPQFYHSIKSHQWENLVPQEHLAALRQRYLITAGRNLVRRAELNKIAHELQIRNIPMIVLKGAYLAEFVYPNAAMREMSDIDLLLRAKDLQQAANVLEALGYEAEAPYFIESITATTHHLPGFGKNGVRIELHWTILSIEVSQQIQLEDLWKRALPVQFTNAEALCLCPEDLLLHVCGHASYHHNFEMGLRGLYDVAIMINHFADSFNWPRFLEYTCDWRWERGIYLVLRLAKELLGAAVPDGVLQTLDSKGFDDSMLATAWAQIFANEGLGGSITHPLATWQAANSNGKVQVFFQRLFLSRQALAARFRISPDVPWIYLYYPVRFFDLLIRYLGTTFKLWRGDTSIAPYVERKARLQSWLNGSQ